MGDIEQINEEFNVKKPKKKGLIITAIVVAVIVIALLLVYFLVFAKPQYVFNTAINKIFNAKVENYNSIKLDATLKASAEIEDTTIQEQIGELEKYAVNIGTQMDVEEQKEIVDLGFKYDNQDVIDARVYYDNGDLYAYFDELFDKYIKIDMPEEQKEQMKEIFETISSEENIEKSQKAMKILGKELKTQINEEGTFEKDKVTIDVDGEEQKVTKSTLLLNEKELVKILGNMCANLADNDDFIDCFDTSVKDVLEQLAEELKDTEGDTTNKVEFSIFTKGLFGNFAGLEMKIIYEDSDQTITATVIKDNEDTYSYNVEVKSSGQKMDILSGKIETEKDKDSKEEQTGKTTISMTVPETGTMKLMIDYSVIYNQGIDKVDTQNNININDMTEEDIQGIVEKLKERPLIGEVIESQLNTNNPTNQTTNSTNNVTTMQNQVKDYGYLVTYSVPQGFEYDSDYSYDYRKYYDGENQNGDASVIVAVQWDTEEEYLENSDWDYNYYSGNASYKNVNLSEIKTINVAGNEFKYKILTYESNSEYYTGKYQNAYIWYKLDDEHIFNVEIETTNMEITESLITSFLNIQVSKVSE